MTDLVANILPEDKPRYLMGVGTPANLLECIALGIDMFDCVIQTRHSRSGMFYTSQGRIRMTDSRFRNDMYPPDTTCKCYTCTNFTRAYLHHLFKIGEILSATLATIHNLTWFAQFMDNMRNSIIENRFEEYRKWVHEVYPEKKKNNPFPKTFTESKKQGKPSKNKTHHKKRNPRKKK